MHRKQAVMHVVGMGMCGIRRAARVLGVARSTCHRRRQARAESRASEELLIQVSQAHPELGARKIAALLSLAHGKVINRLIARASPTIIHILRSQYRRRAIHVLRMRIRSLAP